MLNLFGESESPIEPTKPKASKKLEKSFHVVAVCSVCGDNINIKTVPIFTEDEMKEKGWIFEGTKWIAHGICSRACQENSKLLKKP